MGGIISKFEVKDACLEAINAGCDLVLLRDEGGLIDEVIPALVDAVKDGRLSEERLNDAVSRTLGVKFVLSCIKTSFNLLAATAFDASPITGSSDCLKNLATVL